MYIQMRFCVYGATHMILLLLYMPARLVSLPVFIGATTLVDLKSAFAAFFLITFTSFNFTVHLAI